MLSRILQHMISYIFIPKRGHQDDVSFLEAFLVDNILTERKINMGYIIFFHMKVCSLSKDLVLPYGVFITKIVKYFNVNLRNETDDKKLKSFDTYDRASLHRMHFVGKKNGLWGRKSFMPHSKVDMSSNNDSSEEENENEDVEGRCTENENATALPSNNGVKAKMTIDHPSQIARNEVKASDNLNAQISSIGMSLEEMTLANDWRLTSLKQHINGFQEEFKASM